jgi:hypothetical protein
VHRALDDAGRLASHAAQIETLIQPPAPDSTPQGRPRADQAGIGDAAP